MADNFINKINVNNEDYFISPTFTSQTKNYILAAPTNENGVPSFRALALTDLPPLSLSDLTTQGLNLTTVDTHNKSDIIRSDTARKFFGNTSGVDFIGLELRSTKDGFQLVAQFAADRNTLLFRQNDSTTVSASTWSAWQQLVHTPFTSGVGGAGTENCPVYIASNGTATAITAIDEALVKDALNTDDSTTTQWLNKTGNWSTPTAEQVGAAPAIIGGYLPLSGGEMTGPLAWKNSTALPSATSLTYILGIDAFESGGTTKYIKTDDLRTSLGLSNALHFIGVTSTTLSDGSTTSTLTAKSSGSLTKTTGFVDGDVVMDGDQLREYVWSGSAWRLLGITTSTAYSETTSGNTFISSISQGTDGKITADSRALDTSGTWSGTATKATTTADTSNTLYVVGVTSSATTTLKRNTSVTVKGGAVSATTYNGLTLTAASTGFTIAGGTTSKTLTVNDTLTLKTGTANYIAYYSETGTISGHSQAQFSDTWTPSTKNGKNELMLGNNIASTSNGSAYGQLALYSESTAGTYLKSESGTTWTTASLQAKDGIIALMSDVTESKIEIIRLT